jgi:hypothetical protein
MADTSGHRRTRRQARESRRMTHKRQWKQSGGADWPKDLPAELIDALSAKGFTSLIRLKAGMTTPPTDNQIMEDYIKCLERQDEIFEVVIGLIRQKVSDAIGSGLDLNNPEVIAANIVAINAQKGTVQPYIDAAESLITFVVDKIVTDETKLQEIRSDKTPLSLLLLFPAKLRNLLIEALANIFVVFKDNKKALLLSPLTKDILAAQYEGYAQSLAYTLTARPLRDGFFLNQGIKAFKREIQTDFTGGTGIKFWPAFADALFENRNMGKGEINNLFTHDLSRFDGCTHSAKTSNSTWGKIAADVFTYHELQPEGDILELFSKKCGAPRTYDIAHVPTDSLLDIPVRKTTLRNILSNIDDATLQFILQLSYAIKKTVRSTTPESGESTA